MNSSIQAIVDSNNTIKIAAASNALNKAFAHKKINIKSKLTNSGVNSQPVGLEETTRGALNRMRQCISKNLVSSTIFFIGIENGLVPGHELNQINSTTIYSPMHWYDIGICAVTMIINGCSFKYISYAEPLQIPNEKATGLLPPSTPMENDLNIKKYRQVIMPLIGQNIDLYQWFSSGRISRESTLTEACANAIFRLSNIPVFNHLIPKPIPLQ
jgi:non-canonical (house-cleaning) NTP pyrophosphatase